MNPNQVASQITTWLKTGIALLLLVSLAVASYLISLGNLPICNCEECKTHRTTLN